MKDTLFRCFKVGQEYDLNYFMFQLFNISNYDKIIFSNDGYVTLSFIKYIIKIYYTYDIKGSKSIIKIDNIKINE